MDDWVKEMGRAHLPPVRGRFRGKEKHAVNPFLVEAQHCKGETTTEVARVFVQIGLFRPSPHDPTTPFYFNQEWIWMSRFLPHKSIVLNICSRARDHNSSSAPIYS